MLFLALAGPRPFLTPGWLNAKNTPIYGDFCSSERKWKLFLKFFNCSVTHSLQTICLSPHTKEIWSKHAAMQRKAKSRKRREMQSKSVMGEIFWQPEEATAQKKGSMITSEPHNPPFVVAIHQTESLLNVTKRSFVIVGPSSWWVISDWLWER